MLNQEQQLQQVELSLEKANHNVAQMKKLHKLTDNTEFKELILEGYFKKEASRLVLLRADPHVQNEKEQRHIDKLIDGIGSLRQYFVTMERLGEASEMALSEHEEAREEILAEGLHDDEDDES